MISNKSKWRSFEKAKKFVRELELQSYRKWVEYAKSSEKPNDIPANPASTYGSEFKGYGDWLNTNRIANRKRDFWPFERARKFVHAQGLSSEKEWVEFCKGRKPPQIPSQPRKYYKEDYLGIADWLGITPNQRQKRYVDTRKMMLSEN